MGYGAVAEAWHITGADGVLGFHSSAREKEIGTERGMEEG
jgi:hypothetical protein